VTQHAGRALSALNPESSRQSCDPSSAVVTGADEPTLVDGRAENTCAWAVSTVVPAGEWGVELG
jgi:hypothetical protein